MNDDTLIDQWFARWQVQGSSVAGKLADESSAADDLAVDTIVRSFDKAAPLDNVNLSQIGTLTRVQDGNDSRKSRIQSPSLKIIVDFPVETGFEVVITDVTARFAGADGSALTGGRSENALPGAPDRQPVLAEKEVRAGDLLPRLATSVWRPHRRGPVWTYCAACGQPNDATNEKRQCAKCGASLPARPTYGGGQPVPSR